MFSWMETSLVKFLDKTWMLLVSMLQYSQAV